jgi:hypothetical protein
VTDKPKKLYVAILDCCGNHWEHFLYCTSKVEKVALFEQRLVMVCCSDLKCHYPGTETPGHRWQVAPYDYADTTCRYCKKSLRDAKCYYTPQSWKGRTDPCRPIIPEPVEVTIEEVAKFTWQMLPLRTRRALAKFLHVPRRVEWKGQWPVKEHDRLLPSRRSVRVKAHTKGPKDKKEEVTQ